MRDPTFNVSLQFSAKGKAGHNDSIVTHDFKL